jgi:hypothetical protein
VLTGIQFGFTLSFLITFLAFIVGQAAGPASMDGTLKSTNCRFCIGKDLRPRQHLITVAGPETPMLRPVAAHCWPRLLCPEEWLAHAIHGPQIPESVLHLWVNGIDVRVVPIALGMAVIAIGLLH